MKQGNKDLTKTGCANKENLCADQIEKQKVQQHYHNELEKYQEQINRIEKLGSQDGQAA